MQVSPYLTFDGCCEAAFRFYESCLGGKISAMIPHRETPAGEHVAEDWQDKIIHAQLELDGQLLMGTDAPLEHYEASQGFSVTLCIDDPDEAERVFNALAKDGSVRMPMEETFWARRFGMLVDGFGIPWMINCNRPE